MKRGGAYHLVVIGLLAVVTWLLTTADDWPTYLHDNQRSAASGDTTVNTSNASRLVQLWSYKTGGTVAAGVTVANGVAYVGAWDGYEYAFDAGRGTLLWRTFLGTTTGGPTCHAPSGAGISSTAAVVNGVLYVGGGDSNWYALDASTGAVLWSVPTGDNSAAGGHYNWSSPLIANGYAYIGIASLADCPLVQGQLLQVSLTSHQVVHVFNAVPQGQVGGGIWTSPSLDPVSNTIFVTTGTWTDPVIEPDAQAILALDANTLTLKSAWQLPRVQAVNDSDWGDSPLLFTDAAGDQRVAAINKNGTLYAFDRTNLAAGPVWTDLLAYGGQCPLCGDGSVSSGAFANGIIYFAGGNTTIGGNGFTGAVRAIDPATGKFLWEHGSPAPVIPAITYDNGFIVDAAGRYVEVLDAGSGTRLYTALLAGATDAPPSIANGIIYASTTDGTVNAFDLGGQPTIKADANCPPGWTCTDVGNPNPKGAESFSNGTWSVFAGGTTVGSTSDHFRLIEQPATGDVQISGSVAGVHGGNGSGQAGLMVRQRLDANSPYYAVLAAPDGKVHVLERSAFGAATVILSAPPGGRLPTWFEIQRSGDWFQAAASSDGKTYTLVPGSMMKLVMPATTLVGLATSSGASGTSIMATYSGLAIGPVGAAPLPAPSAHPCPTGWSCQDVGDPVLVGDQTFDSGSGTWTLSGSGSDISGNADQFHFVSQLEPGDTTVSADVRSQNATDPKAKAGVMIRQSTDPAAMNYGVFLTPSSGIFIQYRNVEGLKTWSLPTAAGTAPAFIRVTHSGNTFCTFTSPDGSTWNYVPASCATIPMTNPVMAGMAVTSHSTKTTNNATFNAVSISGSAPPPPTVCPSGWGCTDIGVPGLSGSQSVNNGTWSVVGTGEDIWGNWDQFHYVYQPLAGDGTVSAQVTSQTESDPWAKAGVMVRQSTDPSAAYYAAYVTPANGVTVQYRPANGAEATMPLDVSGTVPIYLKISRSNITFCAYTSPDGVTWTYLTGSCVPMNVSGGMLAGMAVTSHNATHYSVASIGAVTFSNTAPPSPTGCPSAWTCADIGNPAPVGGQSVANGTWSVQGGGSDINGTFDQFHYAWQSLTGDGAVSARVVSQTNTNAWAKSGVMLRQSFDPGAAFYAAFLTPSNGISVQFRTTAGVTSGGITAFPGTPPVYLEVTRTGNTYCAYTSPDGSTWTYVAGSCTPLSTTGSVLAGLAVTSHNTSAASTATFDTVQVSPTTPALSPCPAGWSCGDIGEVTPAGSQALNASTWTVVGGGPDIWGTADGFHFVSQPLAGDGGISARVQSLTNTNGWAKAGVMLRRSTDPGSPYYAIYVTPGNGVSVQFRSAAGGAAALLTDNPGTAPVFLQVNRSNSTFCASTSADGSTWAPVAGSCQVINLSGGMLAGLAVTSHDAMQQASGTFDSVSVSTAAAPSAGCASGWSCADIGNPTPFGGQSVSSGTWTVQGSGADITGTADQFHYAWQTLAADGAVSARVSSQTNTNAWAKAGVMLRQSSDPSSAFYAAFLTPGNGIAVEFRTAGAVGAGGIATIAGTAPTYLEVTRTGNTYCAYTSSDGMTWTNVAGSCTLLSTSGAVLAGLAVTSHNNGTLSTATFDTVAVSSTIPPLSACPTGWTCGDIGEVTPAGSQALNNGTWAVQGGGPDIWGTADAFHFVWQTQAGDGTVSAHVATQQNTDPWAKAGVMLRASTDPGSPYYAVFVTPGNGVVVQDRVTAGSGSVTVAQIAGTVPQYLQVGRVNGVFTAYTSTDGTTWTPIPGSSVNLSISGSLLEGMAVSSHNATVSGGATFDTVKPS